MNESYKPLEFPFTPATDDYVTVSRDDEIGETLMMGLRLTSEGISREQFQQRFGEDLLSMHGDLVEGFIKQGLLEVNQERVRITSKGRLLSNVVFREFV
jgi:oxygen-independent coproporphyrinogen-3 oxidase